MYTKINKDDENKNIVIQQLLYENNLVFALEDGTKITIPDNILQLLKEGLFHLVKGRQLLIVPVFEWVTASEAAEILSVSVPTVEKWVKQKKIGSFEMQTGKRIRRKLKLQDVLYLKTMLQSV